MCRKYTHFFSFHNQNTPKKCGGWTFSGCFICSMSQSMEVELYDTYVHLSDSMDDDLLRVGGE